MTNLILIIVHMPKKSLSQRIQNIEGVKTSLIVDLEDQKNRRKM
jgi:hypothetical protein